MAAFKQHVTFSSLLGAGYAACLMSLGVEWVHAALAGGLCAVSGMLPDLDSQSSRPVRELFGLAAIATPLLLAHRLRHAGLTPEEIVLVGAGLYLLIRFGMPWLLQRLTVHRGMFHSVPAALIAGELVFLAHDPPPYPPPTGGGGFGWGGRLMLAGGVVLGFLSHLLLDEISSVDAYGLTIRLNSAAGSALKFASKSRPATLATWLLLGGLTYVVGVERGVVQPIHLKAQHVRLGDYRSFGQAVSSWFSAHRER